MNDILKLIIKSKFLKKIKILNSKLNKNPLSKDFSKSMKFNKWNSKNIDFKKFKEDLNEIYIDERLISNIVNFVRENLSSNVKIQ